MSLSYTGEVSQTRALFHSERFSWLDWLMMIALCSALLRLAIPNINSFIGYYSDQIAQESFIDLREWLIERDKQDGTTASLFIINKTDLSRDKIPVSLPYGVSVHYLLSTPTASNDSLTFLVLSHQYGTVYYRLVWINDKLIEQIIQK